MNFDAIPIDRQRGKWGEILSALSLYDNRKEKGAISAEALLRRPPSNSAIARLRASSQELAYNGGTKEGRESIFIFMQQIGEGKFSNGLPSDAENISICDGRLPWRITFKSAFEILVIRMNRRRISEPFGQYLTGAPTALKGPLLPGIRSLLHTLLNDLEDLKAADIVSIENALSELLTSTLRQQMGTDLTKVTQVQAAHFRRITTLIDAELAQPELTMCRVAQKIGVSRRYLQKLFGLHNTTYSEFVRRLRLDRARHTLLQDDAHSTTIADIAFRCGFSSPGHFSRMFKIAFGISPKTFRKTIQPEELQNSQRRGRPSGLEPVKTGVNQMETSLSPLAGGLLAPFRTRHYIAANVNTVHWGFLSKKLPPILRIASGAEVVIETLTQHASDDWERMVKHDAGAESVFHWTTQEKNVDRRGAGPSDASVLGRGTGEGFGVHIFTGPVYIEQAEPGDVLEVSILDIVPRPSTNPDFYGRCFASNVSTWWGYHYSDFIDHEDRREIVTIFEVELDEESARALYSFRWTPQVDPNGIRHDKMDYPGVPIDHTTIKRRLNPMPNVRIPLRPHFGAMTVMPNENGLVDSIPPGNFGGNSDNWRAGKGTTLYLPVAVPGALFSVGDGHAALGDGEVNGTGLECSLTGTFRFILHKRGNETKPFLRGLSGPLLETPNELILHGYSYPNYLRDLGRDAQADVYKKSCLDRALRSAFQTSRKFLMDNWGLDEDAAITILSTTADFGITQVANGNLGIHVIIRKSTLATKHHHAKRNK